MCECKPGVVPRGWPVELPPPTADDWEVAATEFLLDRCPVELRGSALLRRQPLIVAQMAEIFADAQLDAVRRGWPGLRVALGRRVGPEAVAEAMALWAAIEARLVRRAREVSLVASGLRGEVFRPRL